MDNFPRKAKQVEGQITKHKGVINNFYKIGYEDVNT